MSWAATALQCQFAFLIPLTNNLHVKFLLQRPCSRSSPVWTGKEPPWVSITAQSAQVTELNFLPPFFIQCLSWSLWTEQLHGLGLVPEGSLNGCLSGNRGLGIFLVRKPVCARKFSACLKGRERTGTDVSSPFHPL